MTPADRFSLLRRLLRDLAGGQTELALGDICRRLDRALVNAGAKGDCTPREVSRNLRAFGFAKAGMSGSGYDREPLYRRASAAEGTCRVCGCTENRACAQDRAGTQIDPCHWVEPDLCSACVFADPEQEPAE